MWKISFHQIVVHWPPGQFRSAGMLGPVLVPRWCVLGNFFLEDVCICMQFASQILAWWPNHNAWGFGPFRHIQGVAWIQTIFLWNFNHVNLQGKRTVLRMSLAWILIICCKLKNRGINFLLNRGWIDCFNSALSVACKTENDWANVVPIT